MSCTPSCSRLVSLTTMRGASAIGSCAPWAAEFKISTRIRRSGGLAAVARFRHAGAQIISPPEGVLSVRQSYFMMVDSVEASDPKTAVFRLKFAASVFLPALADPRNFIYKRPSLKSTDTTAAETNPLSREDVAPALVTTLVAAAAREKTADNFTPRCWHSVSHVRVSRACACSITPSVGPRHRCASDHALQIRA
jgi:hypothetical protein